MGDRLAREAENQIGSTKWARSVPKRPDDPNIKKWGFKGENEDTGYEGDWKCNLFVGDMLHKAGIEAPLTSDANWTGPITAKGWTGKVPGWVKVDSQQRGDVVSDGKHVGIAVDENYTVAGGKTKVYKNNDIKGGTIQRHYMEELRRIDPPVEEVCRII